jgi:hypothetical protein
MSTPMIGQSSSGVEVATASMIPKTIGVDATAKAITGVSHSRML